MSMTSPAPLNHVEPLIEAMTNALTMDSTDSYEQLMHYLSQTRGLGIRHLGSLTDVARFTQCMNALKFHQPPCDLQTWLTTWHRVTDYLIDAGIDELFDAPGSHEWHVLFLPALAARIGGNAVFSDNETDKAMARGRCRELGLLWLDCMKALRDKPVLVLEHLRFVIVSDAQEQLLQHFPAWNILLGCPGEADTSQWLLKQLLPTLLSDINHVCLLEPGHAERVSMLVTLLAHRSSVSIEPPEDLSLN